MLRHCHNNDEATDFLAQNQFRLQPQHMSIRSPVIHFVDYR